MIYSNNGGGKTKMGGGTKLICVADNVLAKDTYSETQHIGATTIQKTYYDLDISNQIVKYPNLTLNNILMSKNWWSNYDGPTGLHPTHTIPWSAHGTVPYDNYHYSVPVLQGISNGKIKICISWSSDYADQHFHGGIGRFSIYILTGKVEWI